MSERASTYENCLCNNWSEHSPVSLPSWLPYSCSKCLQRDTYWGGQSYLLSACRLLDTSWSGRLGRTCVCALWFHIHSLLGSCTLCYLWWNRQGKRCSESLTNQHNRYTKVLIQLPLYFILEYTKSKQCFWKEMPFKKKYIAELKHEVFLLFFLILDIYMKEIDTKPQLMWVWVSLQIWSLAKSFTLCYSCR